MGELKPVFVYSEAFLRCAPWTPVSFQLQKNLIVKLKKGEEEFLCNSVKCLEAFGIPSDIDAVCAHLRRFKDSELARRVFRNLRRFKIPEPVDLITAFDLSVDVKENRTISYKTKKIFKGFLKAFLDLCLELTNGNSCLEEKLKIAFSDVFEGLTPTNFTLKVESSGTTNKRRNVKRWIHIVHLPGCKDQQRYDTMVQHLAFLAPAKGWGMYSEGNRYPGDYTQWSLPPAFRGFELDTDRHSSRNWTAMKAAPINLIEKPALSTVNYVTKVKPSGNKGKKRKIAQMETSDDEDEEEEEDDEDEEDEAPLPKIGIKRNRDSQRQDKISSTVVTSSLTPFGSDDIDPQVEPDVRHQSETNDEQVNNSVTTVPLDAQPSTSGQDEQPETAPQKELLIKDIVSMRGLPEESWMVEGQGTSCTNISPPVIVQPPDEVSDTAASQDDVHMEMTEALTTASTSSSSSASSAAGEAQEEQSVRQSSEDIGTSRETTADLETVNADIDNADIAEIVSQPCLDPDPDLLRRAWEIQEVRRGVTHVVLELVKHYAKELERPGSSDVISHN